MINRNITREQMAALESLRNAGMLEQAASESERGGQTSGTLSRPDAMSFTSPIEGDTQHAKRRTQVKLDHVWAEGGDILGNYTYSRDNNPVDLNAQQARAQAESEDIASTWVYDPQTDRSYKHGNRDGISVPGNVAARQTPTLKEEQFYQGYAQVTDEGWQALQNAMGGNAMNPFIDTFDHTDVNLQMAMMKRPDFNPFYHLSKKTDDRQGNALDYMFDKLKGADQASKRKKVVSLYNNYLDDRGLKASNNDLSRVRMTERLYNKMGLGSVLGDYDTAYNEQFGSGGMLGDNPLMQGEKRENKGGRFLAAYNKKKEELNSKPSVMSLFDEMKEYKDG